ncbi:general stress protein [Nostoc sp. CCY0012]|uniref:general stress protein n=1 Tax=Nostoc sp. CCY0012 TaxID=1056123 RepID=UPI0039C5AC34
MVIGARKRAVGAFSHRSDVEKALQELKASGFSMDRVSVIAKDADHKDDVAGTEVRERVGDKADEGAAVGAVSGGVLGGVTGLLVGLGTLAIPGIGPIMLAGATATTLATTLAGAGIGAAAGSLVGALIGLGIPEERARVYNERVERGHYLVVVEGTEAELARAEIIFNRHRIEEYGVYDYPEDRGVTTNVAHRDVSAQTTQRAIGVYSRYRDAELAISELRDAGFPMDQVSFIAKDTNEKSIAGVDRNTEVGNKTGEGAKAGAATGGMLGGLGGLLVGLGALAIPGAGPVIAGGAVATALASTVAGGVVGAAAGSLVGALVGLGIPEDRAQVYNDRFQRGDHLVIIDGTPTQIQQAEAILRHHGIEEFATYAATDVNRDYGQGLDQVRREATPGYSATSSQDPAVVIIDRRDERV